jgi:hypothetical protein
MRELQIKTDPRVEEIFNNYPDPVKVKLLKLRRLIIETARDIEGISVLEETLKWGEPSYLVKDGSTIRIDWKKNKPEQYAIYFKCTSKLVPTFRIVYEGVFKFEDNRAIIFGVNDKLPELELKNCIGAGLTYHKIKQLPLMGLNGLGSGNR